MNPKVYHVLFICTRNSARSIMAEGLLNGARRPDFVAHSAGSQPSGQVHPVALATLAQWHLPTEGYRSKDWAEFAQPGAPAMDFVFTVCDNAAGEVCPVWPGQPMTAHWGVPDPPAVEEADHRLDQTRAGLPADRTHHAEIKVGQAAIGEGQQVARVGVGVEEAVFE
jgi:arsenate reductase